MGKLVASPERQQLYDPQVQDRYLNEIIAPLKTTKVYFAQNVPWLFCAMVPFSLLPFESSYILWSMLGIAAGSAGLGLIALRSREMPPMAVVLIVIGVNASLPAWFANQHGNTAWYLLGALSIYCLSFLKKHDIAGGIALALLAQKPQYAILFALPALRFRRWKLLCIAATAELALWSIAAYNVGLSNVIGYPKMLMSVDADQSFDGMYPMLMVCLRAFFAAHISQADCMHWALLCYALGLFAFFFLWTKVDWSNEVQVRWALALTVCANLILSPHTYLYDVLLISVAAVLTIPPTLEFRNLQSPFMTAWNFLFLSYPLTSWMLYLSESPTTAFQHEILASFNIVLLVVGAISYWSLVKSDRTANLVQHANHT